MKVCPEDEWEVCMLFETASEEDRQQTRQLSTKEALRLIQTTTDRGNIHQLFYFQDGDVPFELCNCCTCCCYPLREAKGKGDNFESQLRSGYVAVTNDEICVGCGECINSCFFGARQLDRNGLQFDEALCFGCACCLPNCPDGAIRIEFNPERGIPIPSLNL
jgi:ferredoxin